MKHFLLLFVSICLLLNAVYSKNEIEDVYNHYRLPKAVIPKHYNLQLTTHLDPKKTNAFHFYGKVNIFADIAEETNQIILHVGNLTVDEPAITLTSLKNQDENCITSTAVNSLHDYYILKTCKPLRQGDKYKLEIPFSSVLSSKLNGYYKSKYVDKESNEERYLSITQFEPAYARNAFPCFDEPAFKAKFTVTLGHDKKYTALSNMPAMREIPMSEHENYMWTEFEESVPMSTYLVAYSVSDFAHISHTSDSHVLFRTWARRDAIDQCDYAGSVGPKVLSYYENVFGIKYPLPKLDQMAVPDFSAGAMENWGLVTYRETTLLYKENVSSLANKQRVASVIAHELAHQWFGNLVTMKWWSDLWLNEGFATYISSLGLENINPEWKSLDEESVQNQLTIYSLDALKSSHPISQPIVHHTKINEIFDSICYKKGSAVLRMTHLFLGDEALRSGISNYLRQHAYGNAEQDDLWAALTESALQYRTIPENFEIKRILDTWTLQTGYPIITVERNYKDKTAYITQERFLTDTKASRKDFKNCWFVPLTYTTKSEMSFSSTKPKAWMRCDDSNKPVALKVANLPGEQEWLLFNIQMAGLYKVKYDERNFQMLVDTLMSKDFENIHAINRAQLIDDALTLAWSKDQSYALSINLMEYLVQEKEYIPWVAALDNLSNIYRIVRHSPNMEHFKRFMRSILSPIYNKLSGISAIDESIAQSHSERLHRVLIASWSCRFEVGDCVPRSQAYFKEWRSYNNPDEHNNIPTDFRTVVYCTAIRHGKDEDWDFLWERYRKSNVAAEKKTIITALGCSREVWLLQRYLESAFKEDSDIRQQDATAVFSSVGRNEVGFYLAREYFLQNIESLHHFYELEATALGTLLNVLSTQMSSKESQLLIDQFVKQHQKLFEKSEKAVNRALETIEINTAWREANFVELIEQMQKVAQSISARWQA